MEFVLVRHGITEWNVSRRFQGQSDVALSARGYEQAEALAAALRDEPLTRVYTSDLARAYETARIIGASHALEVVTDKRLREFDFGKWEGLTWAEIVEKWPEFAHARPTQARLYAPPGGERFEDVVARVGAFFGQFRLAQPHERILVVTHAGVLHAVIAALQPAIVDPLAVTFATASITRIAMEEGRARIMSLNDVGHLDSIA
ncbi:MAG TPA: histidine phosphatase family protein [Candidatus Acidoferrales bacterium]|nr:histidine phosphatase family protein [Candidatus Acidoferrales bacterium]